MLAINDRESLCLSEGFQANLSCSPHGRAFGISMEPFANPQNSEAGAQILRIAIQRLSKLHLYIVKISGAA